MSREKLDQMAERERERQAAFDKRIYCCISTACLSAGAGKTIQSLKQGLEASQSGDKTEVVQTGCLGLCSRGPLVRVREKTGEEVYYADVSSELAEELIAKHVPLSDPKTDGEELSPELAEVRSRLEAVRRKRTLKKHVLSRDLPFFTKQVKVVLRDVGYVDPEKLEDYLAHGGYQALYKAITEMTPEEVCDEIAKSGLRGRGGAGFPTGTKWHFVRKEQSDTKYVVVNGDEGDPGAYMDRTVMEDNPHQVLEGMMIAAYAVGAQHGYFYIRGEYPIAIDRIRGAIRAARRAGILGKSILGSDFSFNADVRIGAGAFVCGEETALIHSIEGKRGMPRMRPPYPSTSGLWGKPTVINNVETMASVPSILVNGADWYAAIGTKDSKGTKVFALAGQLTNTGLIEVPMGIPLREIVYDIGNDVPGDAEFKAAQTGGPSGGCIPVSHVDTPVDYERLKELGSIMGSGGLVIIDSTTSMPEFARFFMDFCVDESCGKCAPCRVGTVQIRSLLDKLLEGRGQTRDLKRLEDICNVVCSTSLCGLGQSAPNPVLSTLQFFREEYEALIPV
ncbi:MAG: NADH-ubiquinone oxidoreductase-F iron-sulfur binding region domain-containing protein [Anaerolineales bacterium]|jgi:bidirectional [NiFe] hydrogenase diaphorase subunit